MGKYFVYMGGIDGRDKVIHANDDLLRTRSSQLSDYSRRCIALSELQ